MSNNLTDGHFSSAVTVSANIAVPGGDILISDSVQKIFLNFVSLGLCTIFSISGVVTNVINVIAFVKLGFSETTNIILLSLSISDLCLCLGNSVTNIFQMPFTETASSPFDLQEIIFVVWGIPFTYFGKVTSCLTVFVLFERLLCVAKPLKVCFIDV